MKNKNIIKLSFALLFSASLTAGILLGVSKNNQKEVSGYSTSSLPTTIDLNDTSAANIRSYYSSLNSLDQNERKGTNLLKNLKNILKNGQKYYAYDNTSEIWQIYEITDRDWAMSPASSTTYGSYNSSTNKITNYTYGTSNSNDKNNPYIHALYINRNVTNQTKAWGNHNQDEWGINREHVWPKSEGFDAEGEGGARGDPMHLIAGNGYTNNIHSNYFYGYVDTSRTYTNCGSTYSNQYGNLKGYSKTSGGSTYVFEPQDCDKGDIARAVFYMAARYNYFSGSDSDGIDTNNPNLELTQNLSDFSSSFTSSTSRSGKMGILSDLLAWHHADPVDEYEIHRNNLLYTNYTNNRNPFIDFPEWADFIWGTAKYNGSTYQSYSSTPTGYATPSSDKINGYNSEQEATSISASVNKIFYVGETISTSDIEVRGNNNSIINNFSLSNDGYQFTYDDAPSGGNNGVKSFSITYGNLSCVLNVNVARKAHETVADASTLLSSDEFYASNVSKSYSTQSPEIVNIDGVSFDVTTNAYLYYTTSNGVRTYHLSFGKNVGSIKTSSGFKKDLTSVSVVQMNGSRSDGVLSISSNGISWVLYSEAEIAKGSYRYFKFEYTSSSNSYSNIDSISFSIKGDETPFNVANYLMFDDTSNQCLTKFDIAKSMFEKMESSGRNTFMTSNDYVINAARTRLEAWATYLGKEITYIDGDYVVSDSRRTTLLKADKNNSVLVLVLATGFTVASAVTCILIKRKNRLNNNERYKSSS